MTKSELKTGMIVTLRSGQKYMVFRDIFTHYTRNVSSFDFSEDCIVSLTISGSWNGLEYYNEDLTYNGALSESEDIMKVEVIDHPCDFQPGKILDKRLRLLWERIEIKEVTMAEVEAKFGCRVKIVKDNAEN